MAQIKQVIDDVIVTNAQIDTLPHTLWEKLKCFIWGETTKFCALPRKNQNQKYYLLKSNLNTMESLLNTCSDIKKHK